MNIGMNTGCPVFYFFATAHIPEGGGERMREKLFWPQRLGCWWEHNYWVILVLLACFILGAVFGFYWSLPYLDR